MAAQDQIGVVTGAFSYSGAAIAAELHARGHRVRTLTGHPGRAPGDTGTGIRPLDFADPDGLERPLRGASTLLSTYRVRFARGQVSHETAAATTRVLFNAAARARIQRTAHVTNTHPGPASPYPYFRGNAKVQAHLMSLGVPCAIARPAILSGGNGVLVNNIAWLLRRLPVFAIGGRGACHVRAIHVEDLARVCADLGGRDDPVRLGGAGPQSLPFREPVTVIRDTAGSHPAIVPVPGQLIPPLPPVLGVLLRDALLTRDEYLAMAAGLADSGAPATGHIAFTDWLAERGQEPGRTYANEINPHFRPSLAGEPAR